MKLIFFEFFDFFLIFLNNLLKCWSSAYAFRKERVMLNRVTRLINTYMGNVDVEDSLLLSSSVSSKLINYPRRSIFILNLFRVISYAIPPRYSVMNFNLENLLRARIFLQFETTRFILFEYNQKP